jgi:response regulator of citrate/malate metabolism
MPEWRVLIVEDNPVVARLHHRFMAGLPNFAVVAIAETADQALMLLKNLRPDLILLDLALPGEDGLSLLRRVRAAEDDVEVIAVTASRSAKVVRATVHLGVVDYLVKPFTPDRLRQALGEFLHRMAAVRRTRLDQEDVDLLCASGRVSPRWLPKDLTDSRLEQTRRVLRENGDGLTAQAAADRLGVSRVTARRYLEYLVTAEEARVDYVQHGPGRPRKAYCVRAI